MAIEFVDEIPAQIFQQAPDDEIYAALKFAHENDKKAKISMRDFKTGPVGYRARRYAEFHKVKSVMRKVGNFIYVWFED